MIINVDAKALEWVCVTYLSQDQVAIDEILNKIDQHTSNQERFGLPSRLIAKTFVFRLIYGGQAYSYAHDPDFISVSSSEKFWQKVIDEFYNKYQGIANWHASLMACATSTGQIIMPTGRIYKFKSEQRRGDLVWPRTKILNYPVQGLGADLMCLCRVSFKKRWTNAGIEGKLISTIHDSIVVDVPFKEVERTCKLFHSVFEDIPLNFQRVFGEKFNLPTRCDISVGPNKKDLKDCSEYGIILS